MHDSYKNLNLDEASAEEYSGQWRIYLLSEDGHPELFADEFYDLQRLPSPGSVGCIPLC